MFDNHHAPTIPARGPAPELLPPRLAPTCAIAALLSLPLMLAAAQGAAPVWVAALLGLSQTAFVTMAALRITSRNAPAAGHHRPERFPHG